MWVRQEKKKGATGHIYNNNNKDNSKFVQSCCCVSVHIIMRGLNKIEKKERGDKLKSDIEQME